MNSNEVMIEKCPSNRIMVDIGAHHGGYTVLMAKKSAIVYAFEPEPENIESLRKNTTEFNNVDIQQLALSNFTGTTKLMLHRANPGGHSIHVPLDGERWSHKLDDSIDVNVMKLDDWCKQHNVIDIAGIKIDVEAHELEVLQGAEETLKRDHPFISIDVHHTVDLKALKRILKSCGYDPPELKEDADYFFT